MIPHPCPLLEVFAGMPDVRSRRGLRHPLASMLALACCAMLCGARSYSAIAEGEPSIRQSRLVQRTLHDPPRTRRSTMRDARTRSVGLEVHQDSLAGASAREARDAAVVCWGRLGTRQRAMDQLIRTLTSNATPLVCVDEAGPGGSWRARDRSRKPRRCWVVASSRVPQPAGDRVKPDRRDATQLARLMRAGAWTAVDVPTGAAAGARIAGRRAAPRGGRPLCAGWRQGSVRRPPSSSSARRRSGPWRHLTHDASALRRHAARRSRAGVSPPSSRPSRRGVASRAPSPAPASPHAATCPGASTPDRAGALWA
jgi:DDE_Tnp_1-associated